jgi:hypothetical protein
MRIAMKKKSIKKMVLAGMLCIIITTGAIGCGKTNEVMSESDAVYSNLDNEILLGQNEKQKDSVEDIDGMVSVGIEQSVEEFDYRQEESLGSVETDVNVSDTIMDKLLLNELMYGNVGKTLGLGTLVYSIPQSSEEDYKIYFFASKNENERYLPITERNLELSDDTYIFPDAREGNVPIGKFQEFYSFEMGDISGDGVADLLFIACYEVEDEVYYDTRVYVGNEAGYALDSILTQKLNEKYYNAEEYPLWEVLELPHD